MPITHVYRHPHNGQYATLPELLACFPAIATGPTDDRVLRWAWPGGYPVFHVVDGEASCHVCTLATVADGDGRDIECHGVNWEDPYLYCGCGERIESAYADDIHNT